MNRANQPTFSPADGSTGFTPGAEAATFSSPVAEGEPTWADASAIASRLWRNFGSVNSGRYAWADKMKSLNQKLAGLKRAKKLNPTRVAEALRLSEELAFTMASDPTAYLNYAVNPLGLAEFAQEVGALQEAVRLLSHGLPPGMFGAAFESVWSRSPNHRAEPQPVFDAAGWLDAWERMPGHTFSRFGPGYLEPEAWPGGDMSKSAIGRPLWAALSPQQKAAVMALARERDPLPDLSNATYTLIENSATGATEESLHDPFEGALIGREAIRAAWDRGQAAQFAAE